MLGGLSERLDIKNRIPAVHRYIHNKLLNRDSRVFKDIPAQELKLPQEKVKTFLYDNMVPKQIHDPFLKEMENYGLIKILNHKCIEILKK